MKLSFIKDWHTARLLAPALLASLALYSCSEKPQQMSFNYPKTDTVDSATVMDGITVRDPFRWLEDDTSAATGAWVKAQNEVTFGYLKQIPFRDQMKDHLTKLLSYARYGIPTQVGTKLVYQKNDGTQNQSVYYVQEGETGTPEVLLDPNALAPEGTTTYNMLAISPDDKLIGFGVSRAGSDWQTLLVMDLATKQFLPDSVPWAKATGMSMDATGFYYSRYDKPEKGQELSSLNLNHKVYYHKLGTPADSDILVFSDPANPKRYNGMDVSEDLQHEYLNVSAGTSGTELRYRKAGANKQAPFQVLAPGFDHNHSILGNVGNLHYIMTDHGAARKRIIAIEPGKTAEKDWKVIVPEASESIESASLAGGKLFVNYLKDVSSRVVVFDPSGKQLSEVQLPGLGAATGFGGKATSSRLYYQFTSYTYPRSVFGYDVATGESKPLFMPKLDFNPDEFESKRVFFTSKDGTKVPMYITHKKGLKLDGTNPTYLYAYGGFNISLLPGFNTNMAAAMKLGMVYAVANLRGGDEYGEDWHKAGMLLNKQNVFDDFIAAGEYLKAEKYTSSERLCIVGGSNGGLLVGAVMTQRPDLARVAIPKVGVLDMLRYHKFTLGWGWMVEYGNPEDPAYFKYLLGYSPLHNLKKGTRYPATLICTADHDDRVVPAHSFKFAAELQRCHNGPEPVMIRIDTQAGHGGSSLIKAIESDADQLSFMFHNMGINPFAK